MATVHDDAARRVMELILTGASPDEIRARAKEAKQQLTDQYVAIWQMVLLIDNLVSTYASAANWQFGWLLAQQQAVSGQKPVSDRARLVLDIAASLVSQGATTVTSRAVAQQLRTKGVEGSEKDLATSVGNVLARADGWKKVASGEYAPLGFDESAPSEA